MKKFLIAFAAAAIIPMTAVACTYENIKLEDGTVKARWIPCNDESCADYQRHKKMIENQNVHVNDVAPAKPVNRFETANIKIEDLEEVKESTGTIYDKKQHRERNVDAINAENDAINAAIKRAGKLPEPAEKKENR